MLHAKTVTIDGIYGTIGSFNLDFWSSHRNLEVNITVLYPEISGQIEEQFFEDLKVSRYVSISNSLLHTLWLSYRTLQRDNSARTRVPVTPSEAAVLGSVPDLPHCGLLAVLAQGHKT